MRFQRAGRSARGRTVARKYDAPASDRSRRGMQSKYGWDPTAGGRGGARLQHFPFLFAIEPLQHKVFSLACCCQPAISY